MIVLGADMHKRSHTVAAIVATTGEVLGDKTPSVQEANLGEKGRYHRLVVGPPASRESASSICGSLKTAGYSGCWVMQY